MVHVPHTYNTMEGLEDYAGEAVYKRTLPITADMKGKRALTTELAVKIENVIGLPARILL